MKRSASILSIALTLAAVAATVTLANESQARAIERATGALSRLQSEGFAGTVLVACGDLIIVAATHAGPAEIGSGPVTGWCRRARDLRIDTFDQNACTDGHLLFAGVGVR